MKIIKLNLLIQDETKFKFKFNLKASVKDELTTSLVIVTLFRDIEYILVCGLIISYF